MEKKRRKHRPYGSLSLACLMIHLISMPLFIPVLFWGAFVLCLVFLMLAIWQNISEDGLGASGWSPWNL